MFPPEQGGHSRPNARHAAGSSPPASAAPGRSGALRASAVRCRSPARPRPAPSAPLPNRSSPHRPRTSARAAGKRFGAMRHPLLQPHLWQPAAPLPAEPLQSALCTISVQQPRGYFDRFSNLLSEACSPSVSALPLYGSTLARKSLLVVPLVSRPVYLRNLALPS